MNKKELSEYMRKLGKKGAKVRAKKLTRGVPDSQGEAFASPESITWPEFVRVSDSFRIDRPLGRATLRWEGCNLVAKIEIFPDIDIVNRYPAIGGNYTKKVMDDLADGPTLIGAEIFEIALCDSPNADARIVPIKASDIEVRE